ncbi:Methyl methanesulfonate-sensitivity protein 22 [Lasiodiplodia theobromae]|uniref:Uncharacterized protein n=1 Tax=Lasiodiplodia theobromae TaxID=45133 RepID=A0A5N5D5X3_9PEZI|nr:Methyl methanesulfonate-sensitivity protein 22 [Lasiodiplodia theobromae]KAB2573149.1 hypothetical protein DBV05_g8200 [Lasiodiplodia theobromae]KAF4544594.1 Methyl methanesulfonate-sensitivity protein 22 [Lasiodiplodia theobromae]
MSQWRIKGYVLDSDEDEDLDLDDSSTPKPPEAETVPVGGTEVTTYPQVGQFEAPNGAGEIPLGSQDELALDSSQNGLLEEPRLRLDTKANGLSPQCGPHAYPSSHTVNTRLPVSSVEARITGHPSSDVATESSTNALSGRFLATQLFSDDQLTSTPGVVPQILPQRPVTPVRQDDDVDELQQDNISAFSSPLSDARSDIEPPDYLTSSPPLAASRREVPGQTSNGLQQSVRVMIPPRATINLDETTAEEIQMRRALRKRNPIQVHPYLLEAEKYKQNLKSRGLKPVNVAPEHHRHHGQKHGMGHGESQELDSQDRDFVVDHTQSSSVRHSSPVQLPSSPPNLERATSVPVQPSLGADPNDMGMNVDDEDFEFPDLSVLLRKKPDGSVQQGFKRRKTLHTFSKKGSLNRILRGIAGSSVRLLSRLSPLTPPMRKMRYTRIKIKA